MLLLLLLKTVDRSNSNRNTDMQLILTIYKLALTMADIKHTYSTGTLGNDDPVSLQPKIYYEISLHCTRQGYQGLWTLRKDNFVVKVDKKMIRQWFWDYLCTQHEWFISVFLSRNKSLNVQISIRSHKYFATTHITYLSAKNANRATLYIYIWIWIGVENCWCHPGHSPVTGTAVCQHKMAAVCQLHYRTLQWNTILFSTK